MSVWCAGRLHPGPFATGTLTDTPGRSRIGPGPQDSHHGHGTALGLIGSLSNLWRFAPLIARPSGTGTHYWRVRLAWVGSPEAGDNSGARYQPLVIILAEIITRW